MTDRTMPRTSDVMWVCLLVIGIGGLGTWHYSRKLAKAMRTENWQPMMGEILQSEMLPASPALTNQQSMEFSYQYRVDKQEFTSHRVSWANTGPSGLRPYHKGDAVSVYVNPSAPHEAVLIRGTNAWTYVQISLCVAFSLVGVWLFVETHLFTANC